MQKKYLYFLAVSYQHRSSFMNHDGNNTQQQKERIEEINSKWLSRKDCSYISLVFTDGIDVLTHEYLLLQVLRKFAHNNRNE